MWSTDVRSIFVGSSSNQLYLVMTYDPLIRSGQPVPVRNRRPFKRAALNTEQRRGLPNTREVRDIFGCSDGVCVCVCVCVVCRAIRQREVIKTASADVIIIIHSMDSPHRACMQAEAGAEKERKQSRMKLH